MNPIEYLATPQVLLDGGSQNPTGDVTGGLITSSAGTPTNITSATTTLVKSGPGVLKKLCVNTTAAGAITVYDNTAASGTKLATLKASIAEGTYLQDIPFTVGLTIVTAAASDVTAVTR